MVHFTIANIQKFMTPQQFERFLQKKSQDLKNYADVKFPTKAGNTALRFINGNFRAQGFQGTTFKKWKATKRGGTILVKTGKLRSANYFTTQHGQVTLKNNMPYAKVHNEGFKGTVSVKSHTRNKYSKTKVGTGKFTKTGKERTKTMTMKTGSNTVKSHSRKMDIPARQFVPTKNSPSPTLNNAIIRDVEKDIQQILKS